jgi:hypothetical protein
LIHIDNKRDKSGNGVTVTDFIPAKFGNVVTVTDFNFGIALPGTIIHNGIFKEG